jgi:geranylgeranyl diphosphate synthase, type II
MKKKEYKNFINEAGSLYPESLIKIINDRINEYLEGYSDIPQILKKAIVYSMNNGGKRLRPVLCLTVAKSLGKDCEKVLPVACAIEFIHTYSLIHDDLPAIDNDDFRRGVFTCHKKFGEDIAILAGDAIFAEAFNIILSKQESSPDVLIKVLSEIGLASGAHGMVAGQIVDVFFAGKKISKPLLEYMHTNKTGKLITAAIKSGAIISGADDVCIDLFRQYSENIGLAFQITDDLLDLESTIEITGKTSGKDILQNKNTFPSLFGIKKSKKIAEEKINNAIQIVESMDVEKEWLIKIAKFILQRKN